MVHHYILKIKKKINLKKVQCIDFDPTLLHNFFRPWFKTFLDQNFVRPKNFVDTKFCRPMILWTQIFLDINFVRTQILFI